MQTGENAIWRTSKYRQSVDGGRAASLRLTLLECRRLWVAQVAVDFGRCVCPQQMCAINFHARTWHPSGEKTVSPTFLHFLPIDNSSPFQGWNSFCFVLNFSYPHLYVTFIYSLFVSVGAVSSEFNILCISGVNEFWQLRQINLRFSDKSASTMSKHLFCESSILKCCMFTFGWDIPIGNSKDASEKVGGGNCLNKMNLRTRKLESLEAIFFEKRGG